MVFKAAVYWLATEQQVTINFATHTYALLSLIMLCVCSKGINNYYYETILVKQLTV